MAGDVTAIAVRPNGEDEFSWTVELPSAENTELEPAPIVYDGAPLQPGTEYEWSIFFLEQSSEAESSSGATVPSAEQQTIVLFKVLEDEARDRITADLDQIQVDLEAEGADTEAIALARAGYFVENGLLADAMQEMFAVDDPSENLLSSRANLVSELCQPD
ncbi:MAG: hypothetical protein F6K04_01050 [Leptolyngbya sp. SIO4C5]|nr:hypothetical protein [Leptolyngbya sp. SIO4C5]